MNTSAEAISDLTNSGDAQRMRDKVFFYVRQHPGECANEIADALGDPGGNLHKRLSELARDEYVVKGPARVSRITGKRCATWNPKRQFLN